MSNKSSVKSRTHKLFVALPSKRDSLYTVNATRATFLRLLLLPLWQTVSSEMWRDQDQITALLRHGRWKQTVPIIHMFEWLAQTGV
jgi:hypothetical protein